MLACIHQKLNNRRGASMVVALIFFMLCTVIGGIVLTSASVSVGKTTRDRLARQNYLSVSSAAALIKKDMNELSYKGVYSCTEFWTTTINVADPDNPVSSVAQDKTYSKGSSVQTCFIYPAGGARILQSSGLDASDFFYHMLPSDVMTALGIDPASPLPKTCELSIKVDDTALSVPDVSGTLTIAPDMTITIFLQDKSSENKLTLTYVPNFSKPVQESNSTVSPGANEDVSVETIVTTYTTTITWGDPIITKGGGAA